MDKVFKSHLSGLFFYLIIFISIPVIKVEVNAQNIKDHSFKKITDFSGRPYFLENTGGSYLVAGGYGGEFFDYIVDLKGNAQGINMYQFQFSAPNCNSPIPVNINDMKADGNGNFVIVGSGKSGCVADHYVIVVAKLNSNGQVIAGKVFHAGDWEVRGMGISHTSDNSYIVTGCFVDLTATPTTKSTLFLKLDNNLNLRIAKKYSITNLSSSQGKFITENTPSTYLIIGESPVGSGGSVTQFYLKIDSAGQAISSGIFPGQIMINNFQKVTHGINSRLIGGVDNDQSFGDVMIGDLDQTYQHFINGYAYGHQEVDIEDEDSYEEGFSALLLQNDEWIISGSSTTAGYNNQFHAFFLEVGSDYNVRKSLVFGVKCQENTNLLCLRSFGYGVSCINDSVKNAMMTGVIQSDGIYNFIINPGLDTNRYITTKDKQYLWCSQLNAGFGQNQVSANITSKVAYTNDITIIQIDLSYSPSSGVLDFCNLCDYGCIPKVGKILPKKSCNCDMLLKKYPNEK